MKSTFLQVMGILFIVFGAIGFLANLASLQLDMSWGMLVPTVISVIRTVLVVVAGIKAVATYTDRYRASACVVWGTIIIILLIAELITTAVFWSSVGYAMEFVLIFWPLAFALPVLYLVAAVQFVRNK